MSPYARFSLTERVSVSAFERSRLWPASVACAPGARPEPSRSDNTRRCEAVHQCHSGLAEGRCHSRPPRRMAWPGRAGARRRRCRGARHPDREGRNLPLAAALAFLGDASGAQAAVAEATGRLAAAWLNDACRTLSRLCRSVNAEVKVSTHPFLGLGFVSCSLTMSAAFPASAIWMATRGLYPSAAIELR